MKWRLGFVVFALSTAAALAATAPDKAKVEAALKAQGFTSWKSIELDEGIWDVEDAVDSTGKKFDLKLDPKTLKIVKKEEED